MNILQKIPCAFTISTLLICGFSAIPAKGDEPKSPAGPTVSVADFGAKPNDGKNQAGALRNALAFCRTNPVSVLVIPPGVYNFRDEAAARLMDDILGGKLGQDPQKTIFAPYYPYVKGLDFSGLHDLVVEAAGAIMLCDGWMEPVSVQKCRAITIKGLTIDYKREPYSLGKVVEVQPDYFEAVFDNIYPVTTNIPTPRIIFWDLKAHRIFPEHVYFPKNTELVAPQTLRIHAKIPSEVKGNLVCLEHSFHFRPAILIQEAEDTRLEDVTIHSQPGMGIVAHRSKNITLSGLRIVPRRGSVVSTDTDATHFSSNIGLLRLENCVFEGQGDDGINVHNYYYKTSKSQDGPGYDLRTVAEQTHAAVVDYPDVGDTLELVDKSSLATVKNFVVKSVKVFPEQLRSRVEFEEALPEDMSNYLLINATRLPRLEIVGCSFVSNLARGMLIKTRHVLIEHCLVKECTSVGLEVAAEAWWGEGLPASDVTVRYNRFIRCGRGGDISAILMKTDAPNDKVPGVEKHILIEGNIIEGENADRGIVVMGADDVTIRNNEISGCRRPITVHYSDDVKVYGNPGVEDMVEKSVK